MSSENKELVNLSFGLTNYREFCLSVYVKNENNSPLPVQSIHFKLNDEVFHLDAYNLNTGRIPKLLYKWEELTMSYRITRILEGINNFREKEAEIAAVVITNTGKTYTSNIIPVDTLLKAVDDFYENQYSKK